MKLLELLFPVRCPICDRAVPYGKLICPACREKLAFIGGPRCMKCGKPLREETQEYCRDCADSAHGFDRGYSVFSYDCLRRSLYRFKYQGRQEYARFYGKAAAAALGSRILAWGPDALLPIPLHPHRYRTRGYNQAERFAQELGKELGLPVRTDLLLRVRDTKPLKLLDRAERQNNLKKAFKMKRNAVKLNTIVLIDDIYTTGSTIDAAAGACREAGVQRVYFVTLAAGGGKEERRTRW